MYKRIKPLNFASAASATIATAVVLLLAASANAQDGTNSDFPTVPPEANTPAPTLDSEGRVLPQTPPPPPPEPVVSSSTPLPPREDNVQLEGNAFGTRPLGTENRLQALADRQADIEGRRAMIEQKRQTLLTASSSRRGVLSQNLQNLAVGGLNRVSSILSNAITRMKDGSARLRSQADDLQSEGKDMGQVFPLLDEADESLDLANNSLTGIDVNTRYAVTSDSPREDWSSVRDQFRETRALLMEAKQELQEAIAGMKAALGSETTPVTE